MNQTQPVSERKIVVGCGRLGVAVATSLAARGHTVYILDPRADAFEPLPPGKIEDGLIVPLVGDGTLEEDLLRASVRDANVFLALTGTDTANALAAQMAKHLYRVPSVICRIDDPIIQGMYGDLGIVAISATALVAQVALEKAGA